MKENTTIPPPPEKPEPYDCCGSGCIPCVFDRYYTDLDEWRSKYESDKPFTTQSNSESDDPAQ